MTSTSSRLVSIADGEDLLSALRRETLGVDGWVQAVGALDQIELKYVGQGADRRRALTGRATLASLSGPIGGSYGVVLVRETSAGLELHAGLLLGARSCGVSALISHASVTDWISAAKASADLASAQPEEEEEGVPEVGDRVRHFAFGFCDVLMVAADRLKIRDTQGTGKVREISIERLKVVGPTEEDGKRVFTLVRKG